MTRRAPLYAVPEPAEAPEPEAMLAALVPELIRAEETVASTRALVDSWRRRLAAKRRVAFIREEHVLREFGAHD